MVRMAEPETRSVDVPPGGRGDALVEEVRRGDHSAFEPLVRRYENRLMGVLCDSFGPRPGAGPGPGDILRVERLVGSIRRASVRGFPSRSIWLDYLRKRRPIWPSLFSDSRAKRT
jgi:hypothetical protein